MKRILITGANSYIGTSFEKWMQQFDDYQIDTIDLHGDMWKTKDFSIYDSVFHVAGIAHADVERVSNDVKNQYYSINRDLSFDVARTYKESRKFNQKSNFIFMSSIIVYGDISNVRKKVTINSKTETKPSNFYGDSKLQAESLLSNLTDDNFILTIVRPPMIYGENCKGNFLSLQRLASKVSIFPYFENERSVLYIDNLCNHIKTYIDSPCTGIFLPHDDKYKCTSLWIKDIGKENSNKITLIKGFSWVIVILSFVPGRIGKLTKKAFGNLVYE